MKILADASLPGLEQAFPPPFELSFYTQAEELSTSLKNQDILLCRSTLKVNEALLTDHSSTLRYVATASSGSDHIDAAYLARYGIELIDAKGSNAPAVADYVLANLAFLKKQQGFEAKKAGIIGLGEVGSRVAKRLAALGMEILCYDPPKSQLDKHFHSLSLNALKHCDLLCIHASFHENAPYPSKNLFDKAFLNELKSGTVIINASRGGIVNEEALLKQKGLIYCTDVYNDEPAINPRIIQFATLCTPHIAGHSIEAKTAAVEMISKKLHHCYQQPFPQNLEQARKTISFQNNPENWQDLILALYNPFEESSVLKSAAAGELAMSFQKLRKAHQNRHDFSVFTNFFFDEKIRTMLGF